MTALFLVGWCQGQLITFTFNANVTNRDNERFPKTVDSIKTYNPNA